MKDGTTYDSINPQNDEFIYDFATETYKETESTKKERKEKRTTGRIQRKKEEQIDNQLDVFGFYLSNHPTSMYKKIDDIDSRNIEQYFDKRISFCKKQCFAGN